MIACSGARPGACGWQRTLSAPCVQGREGQQQPIQSTTYDLITMTMICSGLKTIGKVFALGAIHPQNVLKKIMVLRQDVMQTECHLIKDIIGVSE